MNRRNFLKTLAGGSIGVAIASALPDRVLAREVGLRDVQIEAEVKQFGKTTVKMKIGDEDYQELRSLVLRVRRDANHVSTIGINESRSSVEYIPESSVAGA